MGSPDALLVNPRPDRRQDSILLAVSYLASSVSGAGVALVLGLAGGEQTRIDGVLAAYSLYALVVLLAAIARTTLVPFFGPSDDVEAYRARATEIGGRAAQLGLVIGVAVTVAAPLAGWLLTTQLPVESRRAAVLTLVLLGPAIALQARASAASALLAGAHRFAPSAKIYTAGAVVTLAACVPLVGLLGALGAPVAVLTGALVLAGAHEQRLRAVGVRLRLRGAWLGQREHWALGRRLLAASSLQLAVQAGLAFAVAAVAGAPGDVTRYSYAFFAALTIVSATSGASSLVALPGLVAQLHRGDRAAIAVYLRAAGVPALAVVVPAVAGLAAFGRPLLGLVFGSTFDERGLDQLYVLCLLLAPLAPLFAVLLVLQGIGTAEGSTRALVGGGLAGAGASLAGALAVHGHTEAVAATHALAGAVLTLTTARAVLGRGAWRLLAGLLAAAAPSVGLAAPFLVGGLALAGRDDAGWLALLAGAACLIVYGVAGARLWPDVVGRFPLVSRLAPSGGR